MYVRRKGKEGLRHRRKGGERVLMSCTEVTESVPISSLNTLRRNHCCAHGVSGADD
jgi:hypothetical protein